MSGGFLDKRYTSFWQRLDRYVPQRRYQRWLWEFTLFGLKQAWACLFGGTLLALLIITKYTWPADAWLTRYDFIFFAALALQAFLILSKLETWEEAKVIFVFHVVGTGMEIFKTAHGSWTYPEASLIHIGNVPLFSGFMYAAVGSYLARTTRILNMNYTRHPSRLVMGVLSLLIYANFFTHHYLPDMRGLLFLATIIAFGRTWVYYRPSRDERRMPLLLGFCLVALFIWLGENVGTYTTSWLYPSQRQQWSMVGLGKYGSWFLLMIISYSLVSLVHPPEAKKKPGTVDLPKN